MLYHLIPTAFATISIQAIMRARAGVLPGGVPWQLVETVLEVERFAGYTCGALRVVAMDLELPIGHREELDDLAKLRQLARADVGENAAMIVAVVVGRLLDRYRVRSLPIELDVLGRARAGLQQPRPRSRPHTARPDLIENQLADWPSGSMAIKVL